MKTSSEYRADARAALSGNWLSSAVFMFVYTVVIFIINGVTKIHIPGMEYITFGCSLLGTVLVLPIAYGLYYGILKQYRGEELQVGMMFKGYNKRVFLAVLVKGLIIFAYCIPAIVITGASVYCATLISDEIISIGAMLMSFVLLIICFIPAFIKQYALSQMEMLMIDNEEMSGSEARHLSEEMMAGKKKNLFFLDLSFIGWIILSVFTLFIGMLWLAPYMYTARAAFYEDIK